MVFGVPSLRLKGLYLAIATLAAHFVIEFTVLALGRGDRRRERDLGAGGQARRHRARRGSAGSSTSSCRSRWLLLFFAKNLFRTKTGKAFVAIRDQDISAEVMGVQRLQVQAAQLRRVVLLRRRRGIARRLPGAHHQPGELPDHRRHRPARHDHHRRPRLDPRLDLRRGLHHPAPRAAPRRHRRRSATSFPKLIDLFAPLKQGVFGLAIVLFLVFEPDGMAARWHRIRNYWKLYPFSY